MLTFADNGVVGMFPEGNSTSGGELGEIRAWMLTQLMWNPEFKSRSFRISRVFFHWVRSRVGMQYTEPVGVVGAKGSGLEYFTTRAGRRWRRGEAGDRAGGEGSPHLG